MFDRLRAEEILAKAVQSVSALAFCQVGACYLVVDGHLLPSPNRAPPTQGHDVRQLQGRDAALPTTGPGWRYAFSTFGDNGELNGCLVLYAGTAPNPSQMIELRAIAGTTAPGPVEETAGEQQQEQTALFRDAGDVDDRLRFLSATVLQLESRMSIQNALGGTLTAPSDK